MEQKSESQDQVQSTKTDASGGRRDFLGGTGAILLGGLIANVVGAQSASAQGEPVGFFELRVYTAVPGKRDALAQRFITRTAAIYARHGITNVGYWIPQQSDAELGISADNTFIYMRGYPSKEERDKRLAAAHADPEFKEVVGVPESNPATKTIIKAHNIDMMPVGTYTAITVTK
jgi:NIPSNAP